MRDHMFSSEGDECLRYDVKVDGLTWSRIVMIVLEANFGTPVGYADAQGQPRSNPPPDTTITAEALFYSRGRDPEAGGSGTA